MPDLDKIIRENPTAAKELEKMKDVIETLQEMRRTGVARGSDIRPFRGRQRLNELGAGTSRRGTLKLPLNA